MCRRCRLDQPDRLPAVTLDEKVMACELGLLEDREMPALIQRLLDTGVVHQLGREWLETAAAMLEAGVCRYGA